MRVSRLVLSTLLLSASALFAQDLKYGVQVHISSPTGDLREAVDSKPGIGLGAHMTVDFGQGHVLRPRLDYVAFPDATVFDGVKNQVNELSLGADYLFKIQEVEGLYLLGGLSANRWKFDSEVVGHGTFSTSSTKLGFALGTGFSFNDNVSAEVRFTVTKFDSRTVSGQNANALQAAVLYRF